MANTIVTKVFSKLSSLFFFCGNDVCKLQWNNFVSSTILQNTSFISHSLIYVLINISTTVFWKLKNSAITYIKCRPSQTRGANQFKKNMLILAFETIPLYSFFFQYQSIVISLKVIMIITTTPVNLIYRIDIRCVCI